MDVDGQCHCGQVKFEATVDPARVTICHCTDCQTLTGSPFRLTAVAPRDTIRITGEAKVYVKIGGSGARRLQHFCPDCGTPLFSHGEDATEWGIRWGSIRQREALQPTRQIWCRSAVPWLDEIEAVPGRPMD
jgi:hypothetical protein